MNSINKQILLGNIGNVPELKKTQSGISKLSLRIATNSKTKDNEEITQWHNVSIWGKRADSLSRILKKGHKIYVEGETRHSKFEKNGIVKWYSEVIVNELVICSKSDNPSYNSNNNQLYEEFKEDYTSEEKFKFNDVAEIPF